MGGLNDRHIGIFTQDTLYAVILPTPNDVHVGLGGGMQIPVQKTTVVCSQLLDDGSEACRIHYNHNKMDTALNTMVLDSVDKMYIFALHNFSQDTWGHRKNTSLIIS